MVLNILLFRDTQDIGGILLLTRLSKMITFKA